MSLEVSVLLWDFSTIRGQAAWANIAGEIFNSTAQWGKRAVMGSAEAQGRDLLDRADSLMGPRNGVPLILQPMLARLMSETTSAICS